MTRVRVDPELVYVRRVVPAMILYVALICAVPFAIYYWAPAGPIRWGLAASPAVPLCAVFWFFGRYLLEERDEYVRMLEIRRTLIATAFALGLATIWGWLEVYGGAPHVPMNVVPVAWFAGLGIGTMANALIERNGRR